MSTSTKAGATHPSPQILLGSLFFLVFPGHFSIPAQTEQSQQQTQEPFEVRLTNPPEWANGCLNVSLDRHSSQPLVVPNSMGLYISMSVKEIADQPSTEGPKEEWINVYGAADILDWDSTRIAAGATIHEEHCFRPEIAVLNLHKQTRRMIPLRGRLRIDAYYFLTDADALAYKTYHEGGPPPRAPWNQLVGAPNPLVSTILVPIPCLRPQCSPACAEPPLIVHGENRGVPDFSNADWEARGRALGDVLERESPACPEMQNPR